MKRYPSEASGTVIETGRTQLRLQLDKFASLGARLGRLTRQSGEQACDASILLFDGLEMQPEDDDPEAGGSPADPDTINDARNAMLDDPGVETQDVLPEVVSFILPSTTLDDPDFMVRELRLRDIQIQTYLQQLRDIIAEKSFLYSHVIRVAPRKVVRTRARANVAKLNLSITHLSRAYTKARLAILRLGAKEVEYPVLLPEHVRASTAILDPNEPGSSTLRLSWLWQLPGEPMDQLGTAGECKSGVMLHLSVLNSIHKSNVSISFGPEPRSTAGRKSCCLLPMK